MPWTTDNWTGRPAAGRATSVPTQARAKTEGGGNKLFVGCLPYSKTEADLEPVFGQFGIIDEVACLKDASGGSKGAAFVTFQDETSASTAMSYLQGHVLEGATRGMNISFASSGGPRTGGGNGGNGAWRSTPQGGRGYAPPPPPGPPPASSYKGGVTNGGVSPPGSKVFVGQLPFSRTEADLMQLFSSVGPVVEVILLKDKKTQEKKGAAFVRYQTAQHAAAAASSLNGFLFSGSTRPITVSIAQSDVGVGTASLGTVAGGNQLALKRSGAYAQQSWGKGQPDPMSIQSEPGAKLFVGQLPFSRNEEDMRQLFGQYGDVVEVLLHRDAQGQKKGGAFVRYQSASNAAAALDLDGYMFQGSTRPITVSIAGDTGAKRRRMS
mmetsp:Transcript_23149/g.65618  ORF Transcript_23149/g.65618 Transcript_23149/m.65618 type:complete len:380 (-) Transcript_23149:77-1216(-)